MDFLEKEAGDRIARADAAVEALLSGTNDGESAELSIPISYCDEAASRLQAGAAKARLSYVQRGEPVPAHVNAALQGIETTGARSEASVGADMQQKSSISRHRYELKSPISNPIVAFFLWAAKSDLQILRSCSPRTRGVQVAQGFFVFTTAIWSVLALHYLLSMTLALSPESVFLGSISWGIAIFMFDRELVGHWSRNSLWIRFALSVCISITIAIPVEMRIFQARIDWQIAREDRDKNRVARNHMLEQQQAIDDRQNGLEKQILNMHHQIQQAGENEKAEAIGRMIPNRTTGLPGKGPAYEATEERLSLLQEQELDIEKQIRSLADDRSQVLADFQSQKIIPAQDFLTRYEAMKVAAPMFSPMWMLSWLVTIVFVLIDMFPILMKAIVPPSEYDHFLSIQEKEDIYRAERIAALNECIAEHDLLTPQPSTLELFEKTFRDRRENELHREDKVPV